MCGQGGPDHALSHSRGDGPGRQGLLPMTGTVADVRAGVEAAAAEARRRGPLVSEWSSPAPAGNFSGISIAVR